MLFHVFQKVILELIYLHLKIQCYEPNKSPNSSFNLSQFPQFLSVTGVEIFFCKILGTRYFLCQKFRERASKCSVFELVALSAQYHEDRGT